MKKSQKKLKNKSPENLLLIKIKIPEMIFYFYLGIKKEKNVLEFIVDDGTPLNY